METDTLFLQLHKLSCTKSEETLEHVLQTLWKTRRSGLSTVEKTTIQSLLGLSSLAELDPVLACLRSLVRKCVHENFTGDDMLNLFPPNLPLDLQNILILLLQKNQSHWKEEATRDQPSWQRTRVSYRVKATIPPSFTPSSAAEISLSMWPRRDDTTAHLNHNDVGSAAPIIAETNVLRVDPLSLQQDDGPPDNLGILPRLKSMTWTMENCNLTPANRVAVISLKLQDYSKSASGETEVKFQLTRDTLEAMLRSMTYISQQLTNIAGASSSGPLQKKQKQ